MDFLRYLTLHRLAKAAYGIVVALILGEIGIYFLLPQQEALQKDLIQRDAALGFRMRPHYSGTIAETDIPLVTNSWGLRDREYGPKRSATLRIYAAGDSMVFGHGVPIEETFPRYLEEVLGERLGRPVEVVNGGVPGYGTLQSAELFAQTADTIAPDLVLLSIAVFNDLEDNVKFGQQLYRWQRTPTRLQRLRTWLRHNSQVYRLFRRYRAGISGREMMQIHAAKPPPSVERGLELTFSSLLRFAAEAQRREIPFVVVINPAHKQASEREWLDTLLRFHLDADEFRHDEPNRSIVAFGADNGLAVLDLLPTFRDRPGENYYFSEHWQAPGHRLVALEIASFLLDRGIVGAESDGSSRNSRVAREAGAR